MNNFISKEIQDKLFPYILLFISLVYIFLHDGCNNNSSTTTVEYKTKEKKGSFNTRDKLTPVKDKLVIRDTIIYKDKKIIVDNTDTTIVNNYLQAKDSIAKLQVILNASKIRKYNEKFENDDLTLNIEAETTGTLNSLKPSWIIKEQKGTSIIKQKETVFAVYGGVEIYNNQTFSNAGIKLELDFQNKKGDLISIGGDTNQNIYLGYKKRFLNIKK